MHVLLMAFFGNHGIWAAMILFHVAGRGPGHLVSAHSAGSGQVGAAMANSALPI